MRRPISQQNWAEHFFVNPDIAKARTLHRYAYTDASFAEEEKEKIFDRSWLLIPQRSTGEIAGDSLSLTKAVGVSGRHIVVPFLDEKLLIWRGYRPRGRGESGQGALNCFSLPCTHLGYPITEGTGLSRSLTCDQHGRKFNWRGKCLGQPGFTKEQLADGGCDLKQFNIGQWEQLLFVNTEEPFAPLDEILGEVRDTTSLLPLRDLTRVFHKDEVRLRPGNWKLWVMNFLDSSHVGFIHSGEGSLTELIDFDSYRVQLHPSDLHYGHSCLQWVYAKNPELGFDPDWLPGEFAHPEKRVFSLYWYIFPSTVLMFFPWGMAVYSFLPAPDDPQMTVYHWYQYVWDKSLVEPKDETWLHTRVNQEDEVAMSLVAANMNSRFVQRGKFSAEKDEMIHWFQHSVSMMMSRNTVGDI